MAESRPDAGKDKTSVDAVVEQYIKTLTPEHKMLVILKAQLYGGSWVPMVNDLNNRLTGKPYIFKLVNRINDDIERIEQMQQFESSHGVDLVDYVELGS
jgi:hypothetical protein